jgi:hypothetical protein
MTATIQKGTALQKALAIVTMTAAIATFGALKAQDAQAAPCGERVTMALSCVAPGGQPVGARTDAGVYGFYGDHWGWIHLRRIYSYAKTISVISKLQAGGTALTLAGILLSKASISTPPLAIAATAAAIIGLGVNYFASRLGNANALSNGKGTRIDAGLRCERRKYAFDPCNPAVWLRARR